MGESDGISTYHAAVHHIFRRWDAYAGVQVDSFWLYQTSDFMTASPSSATASLLRLLTGSDMKGVPILFMKGQRTVLFLPINDRAHTTLSSFNGRSSEGIETKVLLMGKGKPPPGLAEAIERLKSSKTRTLGIMSADISIIEKSGNKLMEELRTQVAGIPSFSMNTDATGLALDILSFIPNIYHASLRAASQEALSCYGKVYNALEKIFGGGRYLDSQRRIMLDTVINSACGGVADVSKELSAGSGTRYIQLNEQQLLALNKASRLSASISLVSTATKDILGDNLSNILRRAIHASALGHGIVNELQVISASGQEPSRLALTNVICTVTRSGMTGVVARTVACAHISIAGAVRSAFEAVERAHRESFDLLTENAPLSSLVQRRLEAQANFATTFTCKRTNLSISLSFDKLELGGVCGALTGAGVTTREQALEALRSSGLAPLCLGQDSLSQETAETIITGSTPLFLVTAAHVTIPDKSISFDILYGDTVLLALAHSGDTQHILTGPDSMRNSTTACLRGFFMLTESGETRSGGPATSLTPPSESSGSDESSDVRVSAMRDRNIEERRHVRQERASRQKALNESQARLGLELQQRIEERFRAGRQKFRKEGVVREIATAFSSVNDYPSAIGGDDSIIYKMTTSDSLFIMINSRPVPIHPNMIHNIKIAGTNEAGITLIRMQLAAPGVVTGKARDNYPQLELYGTSNVFLKEILFECAASKAEKIVEELTNHLTAFRQKQQNELHRNEPIQIDMDIDNVMGEDVKNAILKPETLSLFQSSHPTHYCLSSSNLNQPLQVRPNIERQRSKEGGGLHVHENGLLYLYGNPSRQIRICLLYKNIKTCVFEKLRDSSHIAILYFMFRVPTTIKQLIMGDLPKGEYDEAVLTKPQNGITFLCNFETGVRLSSGVKPKTDREEVEHERAAAQNMRKANKIYGKFLECMNDALRAYEEKNPIYTGHLFKVCTRDRNYPSFFASYQGNQTFHIYKNRRLGCMEPKTQFIVAVEDLDMVVFENLNLYRDSTFHMTFHYRDIRMDPVTISSIQSKYVHDLQDWVNAMGIKYYITAETTKWKDFTTKYYNKREDYVEFLEGGSWNAFFKSDSESSSEEQDDDSDVFQENSYDEDDDDDDEISGSCATSEPDNVQGDDEFSSEVIDFEEESESDHRDYRRRR